MTNHSVIVNRLLFDYASLSEQEVVELCLQIDKKIIRWLGTNHPDNRTRKIFFRQTNVEIGEGTVLNSGLIISDGYLPLVKIGARVAMSPNIVIIAQSAPNNSKLQYLDYVKDHLIVEAPVTIEDDVWIGANAVLLPGVTVGEKSIVGAGSVVTRSVSPSTIVAGVPAQLIRALDR